MIKLAIEDRRMPLIVVDRQRGGCRMDKLSKYRALIKQLLEWYEQLGNASPESTVIDHV